jgi:hypothetical protein
MPEMQSGNPFELTLPSSKEGDEAKITLTPVTAGMLVEMQKENSGGDNSDALWKLVTASIKSWNFTEGGQPLPITEDSVKRLAMPDFTAIINALHITDIQIPDSKKKV